MEYILKLAGWYPSKIDAFNGDFVQRHAKSIALYENVIVVYVVKSNEHQKIEIEKKTTGSLTEIIAYYPKHMLLDKLFSNYYYNKLNNKIIKNIFAEFGMPKLIHVNIVWKAGLIALQLKKKHNIPFVITENSTAYYSTDPNFIKKNKLRFSLYKKVYQNATYLLPVTKDLAETCNTLFQTNLLFTVIENAVDTSLFYPINSHKEILVLSHISTMGYQKNTEALLDSLLPILEENQNLRLQLIGPCPIAFQEKINSNAISKSQINITDNIPYNEVALHLQNSNCLVLFSRYENLPCVILESLCCGVPVIATNVGGINEVLNESNGLLIKSEDQVALYNAIKRMLTHLQNYKKEKIATNARLLYSYETIGQKYSAAYKKILEQTTSS